MMKRLRDLQNWTIVGRGGEEIGSVEDFYIDDERWVVRYLLTNAGGWLVENPVLVSPMAIDRMDWDGSTIHVDLTREQVSDAPRLARDSEISRHYESAYASHYGYPFYWVGPQAWGPRPVPTRLAGAAPGSEPIPAPTGEGGGRLHSVDEISGYHTQALDGEIGHVDDFVFDPETWSVRYLVIDTSNWIGGRTVLVSPAWVRRIDWKERLFFLDMTRDAIKDSPQYDATMELTREYEEQLHQHYGRTVYWR